jgi:hypothetical protein
MYLLCCLVVDVHEEEIFPNITTEIVAQTAHFSSETCDLVFDATSRGKLILNCWYGRKKAVDSITRIAIRARCHHGVIKNGSKVY